MKEEKPELPSTPSYQEDPRFTEGLASLQGLGKRLTSFDFSGSLAPLQQTIEMDPNMIKGLYAGLEPYFRDIRKQTTSDLASMNQLESSVATNRMAQTQSDFEKNLLANMNPLISQAMQNRIGLFGTGLNTLSGATGFAQQAGEQKNQFNLQNYENEVARTMYGQDNQGGLMGGLMGAIGGGLSGFAMGGPVGAGIGAIGGGLGGYIGPSGAGSQLGSLGANMYGMKQLGGYRPGSSASNNPFQSTNSFGNYGLNYASAFGG